MKLTSSPMACTAEELLFLKHNPITSASSVDILDSLQIALKLLSYRNNLLSVLGAWKNEKFNRAGFSQRGPFQFKIEKLHVFIHYHPLDNDFLIKLSQ